MQKMCFPICFFIFGLLISSCKDSTKSEENITQEVSFTKEGELRIYTIKDSITTKLTELDIEIADNDYEIQTGLMYRKSMEANRGMLFIFPEDAPRSFYMKNTEIPLDLIFINSKFKVVSIQKNAEPFNESSLLSEGPSKYVLEVNAGSSDKWNIQKGDSITFITTN